LEVSVQETGPWTRQLAITLPAETVAAKMEAVVEGYRRRAAMPGFRKGKIPTELIKVQLQGSIEAELLNQLIPSAYQEALREAGLVPVAPPRIHDIRFSIGEPLRFLADLEIQPELEVTGYRGLALEQEIQDVDEAVLAEGLEAFRRSRATLSRVERPAANGDVITATIEPVDVHGKKLPAGKREEIRMECGSPTLLPEFREASLGLRAGEARMVTVQYPADARDRQLAGKTRRFRLVAQEIQEKILPELDDNFARSVDSGFDLEGLKAKLRIRLESEELLRSKQRIEDALIERLLQLNPFSLPEAMVSFRLERAAERSRADGEEVDEAAFQKRFRPLVERICRREVLLDAVARQESLAVTEEEFEAELDALAQDAGVEVPVLRRKLEADNEIDRIRDTMQERKVIDFLLSQAQIIRIRKPRLVEQAGPAGA